MSKSKIGGQFSWKLQDSMAVVYFVKTGQKLTEKATNEAVFELTYLFPEFDSFTEVQQLAIYYGVKQKLADSTALPEVTLTLKDRVDYMNLTWDRLIKEGQWNAKGRSDPDKVKVSQRELSKIDSLVELRAMAMLDGKAGFVMPQESKDKLIQLEALVKAEEKKEKKGKK